MKLWKRWLPVVAGLAAVFVAAAAAAQAIRLDTWTPVVSVGWLPAVIAATWPGGCRRCLPRRRTPAG